MGRAFFVLAILDKVGIGQATGFSDVINRADRKPFKIDVFERDLFEKQEIVVDIQNPVIGVRNSVNGFYFQKMGFGDLAGIDLGMRIIDGLDMNPNPMFPPDFSEPARRAWQKVMTEDMNVLES